MNTHVRDNLSFVGAHTHTGAAGDGSTSIGPLAKEDYTDAAAPAAPGAGKVRIFSTSGMPHWRAGAAGADVPLLASASGATLGTAAAGTSDSAARGDHVHAKPTESEIVLADVVTLDVSSTKHGFAPKHPNDVTKFLRGDGSYAVPVSAGGAGLLPGLLGRYTSPSSKVYSGNTSLTTRVNYFTNLTVNGAITLTGMAGGTVIIVEGTLTNLGIISVNALGGMGGAVAAGGYGGGAWGRGASGAGGGYRFNGGFIAAGTIGAAVPYDKAPSIQRAMATGGAGGAAGAGSAGAAWPFTTGGLIDALRNESIDYLVMLKLWELILEGEGNNNATTGAIGGGGGGGGGNLGANAATGGVIGTGGVTSAGGSPGAGGSGIGAGAGGGAGSGATAGAGGRGGGVLLIICKTLDNTGGVISADGAAGANGATNGGGGGGGGGGAVIVAYETLTAAGTLQANGGAAGTAGGGSGSAGAAGGAGLASSFMIYTGA